MEMTKKFTFSQVTKFDDFIINLEIRKIDFNVRFQGGKFSVEIVNDEDSTLYWCYLVYKEVTE